MMNEIKDIDNINVGANTDNPTLVLDSSIAKYGTKTKVNEGLLLLPSSISKRIEQSLTSSHRPMCTTSPRKPMRTSSEDFDILLPESHDFQVHEDDSENGAVSSSLKSRQSLLQQHFPRLECHGSSDLDSVDSSISLSDESEYQRLVERVVSSTKKLKKVENQTKSVEIKKKMLKKEGSRRVPRMILHRNEKSKDHPRDMNDPYRGSSSRRLLHREVSLLTVSSLGDDDSVCSLLEYPELFNDRIITTKTTTTIIDPAQESFPKQLSSRTLATTSVDSSPVKPVRRDSSSFVKSCSKSMDSSPLKPKRQISKELSFNTTLTLGSDEEEDLRSVVDSVLSDVKQHLSKNLSCPDRDSSYRYREKQRRNPIEMRCALPPIQRQNSTQSYEEGASVDNLSLQSERYMESKTHKTTTCSFVGDGNTLLPMDPEDDGVNHLSYRPVLEMSSSVERSIKSLSTSDKTVSNIVQRNGSVP
jgi:hypothetical protein